MARIAATVIAAALLAAPAAARGRVLAIPATADQLIVVSDRVAAPADHLAMLSTYARTGAHAPWRLVAGPWPAEIGRGGLRQDRREGDGSTPIGVFGIGPTIYGTAPDPGGLHAVYRRLVCGDWWDEDPFSPRYNQFVVVPCGVDPGFAAGSEALWTDTVAYSSFAVIRFNDDPIVRGAAAPGSGIFLHSWVGGPTAGCVALPRSRLLPVLRWLDPAAHPAIEIGVGRPVGPSGVKNSDHLPS
jgi:L,D-peptidoglycan transpeptidase YkuD (ErfK/YbiS/YcfS/YnhG family)